MVDLPPPQARREAVAAAAPAPGGNLVSEAEAERHAVAPPPSAPVLAREAAGRAAGQPGMTAATAGASTVTMSSTPPSTEVPTWRHDSKSWLAEIERLRNAGDTARADAEYAEYKRQQRAYAGAPDR